MDVTKLLVAVAWWSFAWSFVWTAVIFAVGYHLGKKDSGF